MCAIICPEAIIEVQRDNKDKSGIATIEVDKKHKSSLVKEKTG